MKKKQVMKKYLRQFASFVISLFAYAFILKIMTWIFQSFQIRNFWYCILATVIIYVLNVTIKPVLFQITLPLLGISYGLFYFVLNGFVFKLTDWILGSAFTMSNFGIVFLISILITVFYQIFQSIILKPLVRRI